jgi:hypothetical protein
MMDTHQRTPALRLLYRGAIQRYHYDHENRLASSPTTSIISSAYEARLSSDSLPGQLHDPIYTTSMYAESSYVESASDFEVGLPSTRR